MMLHHFYNEITLKKIYKREILKSTLLKKNRNEYFQSPSGVSIHLSASSNCGSENQRGRRVEIGGNHDEAALQHGEW